MIRRRGLPFLPVGLALLILGRRAQDPGAEHLRKAGTVLVAIWLGALAALALLVTACAIGLAVFAIVAR